MTTRREFLHASLVGSGLLLVVPTLASLGPAVTAAADTTTAGMQLHGAVFEAAQAAGAAFGASAARRGLPTYAIGDDITPVWRQINDLWRKRPVAISGLTSLTPLLLLEQSARDHGLRAVSREHHPATADGQPVLYSWVLAPRPALHGAIA